MKEQSTETRGESRPVWESLEAFAGQGVQELLQRVLEEEVATLLGRDRYVRREGVDAPAGYRNGYGKPRRLSLSMGTITLRRPASVGWPSGSRASSCRCSSVGRRRWGSCCRSCTCMAWRWATSTWRCAGCSATARRCRPPRSPV